MQDKHTKTTSQPSHGNVVTPDRGRPSGHTPEDATETRSSHRTDEPAGAKNHAPTEKSRPTDTGRGGA